MIRSMDVPRGGYRGDIDNDSAGVIRVNMLYESVGLYPTLLRPKFVEIRQIKKFIFFITTPYCGPWGERVVEVSTRPLNDQ